MEAMSCGLPAILSHSLFENDFGPDDGVALIDREAGAIVETLSNWHDDDALFAKVRGQALSYAERHFDAAVNGVEYHKTLLGQGE